MKKKAKRLHRKPLRLHLAGNQRARHKEQKKTMKLVDAAGKVAAVAEADAVDAIASLRKERARPRAVPRKSRLRRTTQTLNSLKSLSLGKINLIT